MKRFVVLLLSILLSCACLPAFAQGDFILIDDITWSTPVEEYYSRLQSFPLPLEEGEIYSLSFEGLSLPGIDGQGIVMLLMAEGMDAPFIIGTPVIVNTPPAADKASALRDAFELIAAEGDRLYAGRSEVIFSSVPEMFSLLEDDSSYDPSSRLQLYASLMNVVTGIYQSTGKTSAYDGVSGAKAWLVNDRYVATALYSGVSGEDSMVFVFYTDLDALYLQRNLLFPPSEPQGELSDPVMRLNLPAGCNWGDSSETVIAALGDAYFGMMDNTISAAFSPVPFCDSLMIGNYYFVNDRLLAVIYRIFAQNEREQAYFDACDVLGKGRELLVSEAQLPGVAPLLPSGVPTNSRRGMVFLDDVTLAECFYTDSGRAEDEPVVFVLLHPLQDVISAVSDILSAL